MEVASPNLSSSIGMNNTNNNSEAEGHQLNTSNNDILETSVSSMSENTVIITDNVKEDTIYDNVTDSSPANVIEPSNIASISTDNNNFLEDNDGTTNNTGTPCIQKEYITDTDNLMDDKTSCIDPQIEFCFCEDNADLSPEGEASNYIDCDNSNAKGVIYSNDNICEEKPKEMANEEIEEITGNNGSTESFSENANDKKVDTHDRTIDSDETLPTVDNITNINLW